MKAVFCSTLILVLATPVLWSQPGPARGPGAKHLARVLKLSEAQQASIRSIREKSRPTLAHRLEALQQTRIALRAALADAATPEAQLRTLHDKASAAQLDLMLSRRMVRSEVQALLTAEQRAKAAELRTLAQANRQQRLRRLRRALGNAD